MEENNQNLSTTPEAIRGSTPNDISEPEKKKFLNKKWLVLGLILLVLILVGAFAGYFFLNSNKQIACTTEAKLCPDGSSVGRTGPKCEFAACPTPTPDITANWKTYANVEHGFEFKYPPNLVIKKGDDLKDFHLNIQGNQGHPDFFIIGMAIETLPKNTDLLTYIKSKQYITIDVGAGNTSTIKIFDEVKSYSTNTLNGYYYFGGYEYMGWDVFFEKNGKVYNFSLNKDEAGIFPEPEKKEPNILDKILSTFKFTQ